VNSITVTDLKEDEGKQFCTSLADKALCVCTLKSWRLVIGE